MGNSSQSFQDYYNALSQSKIHAMRLSIYESSIAVYDNFKSLYGVDNDGNVKVPEWIKEREWEASVHKVFEKIKDDFATKHSGIIKGSANFVFNPFAQAQWIAARALAVTSNKEAKRMIVETGVQCGVAYLGGNYNLNLKPNPAIFGANEGWGWFGKNGMKIGGYKIEAMYSNPTIEGGTFFSIKQTKVSGSLFRLDYGPLHSTGDMSIHGTYRFFMNGTQIGGSKTQIPFYIWK